MNLNFLFSFIFRHFWYCHCFAKRNKIFAFMFCPTFHHSTETAKQKTRLGSVVEFVVCWLAVLEDRGSNICAERKMSAAFILSLYEILVRNFKDHITHLLNEYWMAVSKKMFIWLNEEENWILWRGPHSFFVTGPKMYQWYYPSFNQVCLLLSFSLSLHMFHVLIILKKLLRLPIY